MLLPTVLVILKLHFYYSDKHYHFRIQKVFKAFWEKTFAICVRSRDLSEVLPRNELLILQLMEPRMNYIKVELCISKELHLLILIDLSSMKCE